MIQSSQFLNDYSFIFRELMSGCCCSLVSIFSCPNKNHNSIFQKYPEFGVQEKSKDFCIKHSGGLCHTGSRLCRKPWRRSFVQPVLGQGKERWPGKGTQGEEMLGSTNVALLVLEE